MADVINLEAHRAARAGDQVAAVAADFAKGWVCRLDVFAPDAPGGTYRAAFLDFNLADGLDAPTRLEGLAEAFEQIATSLRAVARADAG